MPRDTPSPAIKELCRGLYVDDEMLRQFMKLFQQEIKLGLDQTTVSRSSLKCYVTYIHELPTGKERGQCLALDFSGVEIRLALVTLKEKSFDLKAKHFTLPPALLQSSGEKLFDFIAQCVNDFATTHKVKNSNLRLGFSFGFPSFHKNIKCGILTQWVKEFQCSGVVDEDVVLLLEKSLAKIPDLNVEVTALINNTSGTLLSCAWKVPSCRMGFVLDWGFNICYMEKIKNIPKYRGDRSKEYVVINTECGNFGSNGDIDFIRTSWDKDLDVGTTNPGFCTCEKMISALYLGELVRRVICTAVQKSIILKGTLTRQLATVDSLSAVRIMEISKDTSSQRATRETLKALGYKSPCTQDCIDLEYVCRSVWERASALAAACITAVINYLQYKEIGVGVDGSFFHSLPRFQDLIREKIMKLKNPDIQFQYVLADDRGGLGAALATTIAPDDDVFVSKSPRDSFFRNYDPDSNESMEEGRLRTPAMMKNKGNERRITVPRDENQRSSAGQLKVIKPPTKDYSRSETQFDFRGNKSRTSKAQMESTKSTGKVTRSKSQDQTPRMKSVTSQESQTNVTARKDPQTNTPESTVEKVSASPSVKTSNERQRDNPKSSFDGSRRNDKETRKSKASLVQLKSAVSQLKTPQRNESRNKGSMEKLDSSSMSSVTSKSDSRSSRDIATSKMSRKSSVAQGPRGRKSQAALRQSKLSIQHADTTRTNTENLRESAKGTNSPTTRSSRASVYLASDPDSSRSNKLGSAGAKSRMNVKQRDRENPRMSVVSTHSVLRRNTSMAPLVRSTSNRNLHETGALQRNSNINKNTIGAKRDSKSTLSLGSKSSGSRDSTTDRDKHKQGSFTKPAITTKSQTGVVHDKNPRPSAETSHFNTQEVKNVHAEPSRASIAVKASRRSDFPLTRGSRTDLPRDNNTQADNIRSSKSQPALAKSRASQSRMREYQRSSHASQVSVESLNAPGTPANIRERKLAEMRTSRVSSYQSIKSERKKSASSFKEDKNSSELGKSKTNLERRGTLERPKSVMYFENDKQNGENNVGRQNKSKISMARSSVLLIKAPRISQTKVPRSSISQEHEANAATDSTTGNDKEDHGSPKTVQIGKSPRKSQSRIFRVKETEVDSGAQPERKTSYLTKIDKNPKNSQEESSLAKNSENENSSEQLKKRGSQIIKRSKDARKSSRVSNVEVKDGPRNPKKSSTEDVSSIRQLDETQRTKSPQNNTNVRSGEQTELSGSQKTKGEKIPKKPQ